MLPWEPEYFERYFNEADVHVRNWTSYDNYKSTKCMYTSHVMVYYLLLFKDTSLFFDINLKIRQSIS